MIKYTEFGITSHIKKTKSVGKALIGMREGKPFTMNNKLFINLNKRLHEIQVISFENENGQALERKDVSLDTSSYVIGIIEFKDSVVIVKREKPERTYHVFPGGHVREGESKEEALEREMMEEVGIDIQGLEYEEILSQHKEGFGPETAYIIKNSNEDFEFKSADPDDSKSSQFLVSIDKLNELENLLQTEVVESLFAYKKKTT